MHTNETGRARAELIASMVISLFAGVVFLGEPFGWASIAASAMIVLGIWGVQRS